MHPPEGAAWLVWLETSALAVAMRQWQWLYPIVEILHILGFVLVVGGAFFFDLRLLGRGHSLAVSGLADASADVVARGGFAPRGADRLHDVHAPTPPSSRRTRPSGSS